ncbi:tellurium resistance protein TerD [Anaerobacterium chartisolvens]|uniref:Tellurium resistance protein TerD n=1 Tax=Anaerobacterium chartisolvens TaxID=1297424 RepID=A0A369B843_9FIRM|nr:TerD family protein [Anaerobacterium chartisolvens]RCX17601.1 tellurium resistance protein TerD [Anaerobacterium chartisolvens]
MPVNLSKGQRVSLDKSITLAMVGLGWDTNQYDGGYDFDLDAAAFLLGENGKVLSDNDFIFYNNLDGRNGAVKHTGDNLTGEGDGDDEVILINFSKMPSEVHKVAITVTIHDAVARRQNFGQVSNAYVRVAKMANDNDTKGEEVLRFNLVEEFSVETALVVCEIYRHGKDWKFNAVAAGYQGGLEALCRSFGVNV